jgi:uncharacterized membrane protein (DUF106 family)
MWTINSIFKAIFDAVYAVLGWLHPAVALVVISGVFGVAALLVIRYCSHQTAIGRIKDEIKAHLLAIKLYKDELRVMFRAMPRILWATARLQAHMIPPLLVMIVPMILICAQMAAHHEWRPLPVGQRAVLTVGLRSDAPVSTTEITPQVPPQVTLDHRVRSVATNEIAWYVQASQPGRYDLAFLVGDRNFAKELVVGDSMAPISPKRHNGGLAESILYPRERPLAADSVAESISIAYPAMASWVYGSSWWIFWFLVLSIAIALIFKPFLKVKL